MGIGITLGGVAQGLESAEKMRLGRDELEQRRQTILQDTELRKRALAIQESALKRSERRDLISQADKIIGDHLTVIGKVVAAGKAAGHTPEQIAAAAEPLLADVDKISALSGTDSSIYRKQVSSMLTGPTAAEAATAAGSAEADKKLSEARALEAAGVDQQTARQAAGIGGKLSPFDRALLMSTGGMPAPVSPDQVGVKSFTSEAELQAAFERGEVKAGDTVTVGGQRGVFR